MSDSVVDEVAAPKGPRFSGHESFACRYAWLPKAYTALKADPALFSDEENAMIELGIGKNMVRSLRFWVEVMGVAAPEHRSRRLVLTGFGDAIFGLDGFDPYLEDPRTLWLLHWTLSSRRDAPLFAWDHMLGHWPFPEFTRTQALAAFARESAQRGLGHSEVTLAQHFDVFLHTYLSARGATVGVEDSLDGPLVDLHLLVPLGDRRNAGGRWEAVYGFRREPKPEISTALFDYCLIDFWTRFSPSEETLTLRQVALAPCSPGQVFKLSEDDVRTRLEEHSSRRGAAYTYQPSAVQGLLTRQKKWAGPTLEQVFAGVTQ